LTIASQKTKGTERAKKIGIRVGTVRHPSVKEKKKRVGTRQKKKKKQRRRGS